MDNTKTTTHIGLCAGYGGIELGLHRVVRNLRTVALCEIEGYACANLVAKMEAGLLDAAPIWTDLKTFPWADFRDRVDILTGGYPCQPFSAAGKRLGAEDPRHLWPYIADGIRILRPKLCFFENVEGHISLGLREVIGELESIGYTAAWGIFSASECLDASGRTAPHQRKRVFILAYDKRERVEELGRQISVGSEQHSAWDDGKLVNAGIASANSQPTQCGGWNLSRQGAAGESGHYWPSQLADAGCEQPQGWCGAADGQQSGAGGIPRGEPAPRHDQVWPSRPGEPQHGWEPPRVVANSERGGREKPKYQHTDLSPEPSGGGAEAMGNATQRKDYGRESRDLGQATGEGRCGNDAVNGTGEVLGHAHSPRPQERPGQRGAGIQGADADGGEDSGGQTQPPMGGDSDGPAGWMDYAELYTTCDNRTDELRLLGNGVVPATAERAFRTLMEEILKGKN